MDLVFGKITDFLPYKVIYKYDIISTYRGFMSGPFALFRNVAIVNNLFKRNKHYRDVLENSVHMAYDEVIQRPEIKGITVKKLFYFVLYLCMKSGQLFIHQKSIAEFRYQFQWYFKKLTANYNNSLDFTDIIVTTHRNRCISALFSELIASDGAYKRNRIQNWDIEWRNGELKDLRTGQSLLAFHFVDSKSDPAFIESILEFPVTSFRITRKGII